MAKRSARIPEKREKKSELNCKWGLFSIFESHHGCASRKLHLNGRPGSKHILNEYPRKPDMLANFDEECRKIKDRTKLASLTVDASEKSLRNSIRGDMSAKKQIIDEKQKLGGTDSDVFDHSAKNQKISSKISESASKSMVHHPKNAAKETYQNLLGSAEIFPNKLNIAAILEATYNQIRQEDNTYCGGAVDDINVQLVQMSAKAFVDQMFLDRKSTSKEGSSSESKQFSDALEILNSNKDSYVKLLKDPNSILAKYIKNLQKLLMEKEATKSVLDGNVSKFGRKDEGSFVKFECTAEIKKENVNNLLSEKIKYQREYPSKGSYTHQPTNKIVVLKPTSRSIKYPENVACHCSSLQSRHSSSKKGPDEKPTYFCFREMKRKLKYSIGGSGNAADSSTNAKTKDETYEKLNLNSSDDTDTSCTNEMVCKKIDPSRVRFTEKQEPDIIMEAKRHLSARLKNVTATESPKGEKFPKTLGRILSTPEPDSRPPSPRRDGECDTASAQMRFDPCSDLQMAMESGWNIEKGRQRTRVSAWRQNAEVPSGVDFRKAGDSRIQNIVHEVNICSDSMYNGESHIEEVNGILEPGNMYTLEVPNELNSTDVSGTTKRSNTIELNSLNYRRKIATQRTRDWIHLQIIKSLLLHWMILHRVQAYTNYMN